jgi:hypothetical protein
MTRAERLSIAGAATAHLVLLAALSLAWQNSQKMLAAPTDAVPVEIVDISEAPRTPEPPKPSMEAAPHDTAAAAPEAETAPEPEPVKADAVPPPEPTKPTPPKPKAATPTKAPPSPLDTSTLSSLIDKALPKATKKPLDTSKLAKELNASAPARATVDPRAAVTLAQAIRAQVAPCDRSPPSRAPRHTRTARALPTRAHAARPSAAARTAVRRRSQALETQAARPACTDRSPRARSKSVHPAAALRVRPQSRR